MPRIEAAKKALRQTRKRTAKNRAVKDRLKDALKKVTAKNASDVQALIDKAAKQNIIHRNKAARLKSRLMQKISK